MENLPAVTQPPHAQLAPVDPAAFAAAEAAKARIQAGYIMAKWDPRNIDQARDRILRACRRPAFAEKAEYSKPVGKSYIKGPSIRLAETALREWGNVLTETQVVYEDDLIRRVKVFCTDLETNMTFSKEIQVGKTVERKKPAPDREIVGERTNTQGEKVYVVRATEDELANKEAAQVSKAIRNEDLRLIPTDIIEDALDAARATLRTRDAQDPDAAKKKLLDAFSAIGVKPRDIQEFLGHPTDQLQPAELEELRTMYAAIRDGEAKWSDFMAAKDKQGGAETAQADAPEPAPVDPAKLKDFERQVIAKGLNADQQRLLSRFVQETAAANNMAEDRLKAHAADKFEAFWTAFEARLKKEAPQEPDQPAQAEAPAPETKTPPPSGGKKK